MYLYKLKCMMAATDDVYMVTLMAILMTLMTILMRTLMMTKKLMTTKMMMMMTQTLRQDDEEEADWMAIASQFEVRLAQERALLASAHCNGEESPCTCTADRVH